MWGPDSWEAWDELVRLDQQLGRFFASLDEVVGPDGWVALLSGDHGITTMPEAAAGVVNRLPSSAEGSFHATAPNALPRAISGDRKLQPSMRLIRTMLPPASRMATAISRLFCRA